MRINLTLGTHVDHGQGSLDRDGGDDDIASFLGNAVLEIDGMTIGVLNIHK